MSELIVWSNMFKQNYVVFSRLRRNFLQDEVVAWFDDSRRFQLLRRKDTANTVTLSQSFCWKEKLAKSLLYGIVNATPAIPTIHEYAVIIFSHHTFANFMSVLSKFVIFSSAVHQLIVTIGISTASLGVCLVLIDTHNLLLCATGFLGGATLLLVSQNFKNPFALSTAIMIMPVLFFIVLATGRISLEDAPGLGMVFIIAISSSLDVVAIEIDMGSKLNINHEPKIVGWSNVDYTGSYIFGQTIFTCRSQTSSRIVGVCVILAEVAIVTVSVSVMSYVPRIFLAATLFFVALDLMLEWLVLACRKMCVREWAVVWLSFLVINLVSLDVGMPIGDSIERESIRLQCLVDAPGASQSLTDIDQFFRKREIPLGCEFFHVTEPSNSFFLLANDRAASSDVQSQSSALSSARASEVCRNVDQAFGIARWAKNATYTFSHAVDAVIIWLSIALYVERIIETSENKKQIFS
eukprot:jgi/Phyca11/20595/fgenesh1_pg.PHYCAscaffold_67_\